MLLKLDEVGENYENLKVKVTSYTSNTAELSRGQKETAVPMELDYVSGSEMYDAKIFKQGVPLRSLAASNRNGLACVPGRRCVSLKMSVS